MKGARPSRSAQIGPRAAGRVSVDVSGSDQRAAGCVGDSRQRDGRARSARGGWGGLSVPKPFRVSHVAVEDQTPGHRGLARGNEASQQRPVGRRSGRRDRASQPVEKIGDRSVHGHGHGLLWLSLVWSVPTGAGRRAGRCGRSSRSRPGRYRGTWRTGHRGGLPNLQCA